MTSTPAEAAGATSRRSSSQWRDQPSLSSQQPRRRRRSLSPATSAGGGRRSREGTPAAAAAALTGSSSKQRDESGGPGRSGYERSGGGTSSSRDSDGRDKVIRRDSDNRREGKRGGSRRSNERGGSSGVEEKLVLTNSNKRRRDLGGSCDREKSREHGNCEPADRQARERKERSPSRGRRADNVGIGRGLGDSGGWMERERGLRRHRGERRPSSERLLPPEAFQHNREDRKHVPPKTKTVPNSPPSSQKRTESREKSEEKKRQKDDEVFGKTLEVSEAELLRDGNVHKLHESSTEPGDDPADHDTVNVISGDSASSNSGDNVKASIDAKDREEEVFSDFGESDEEILTNDGVLDLGNEMSSCGSRGTGTSIKPDIRLSTKQPTQAQNKDKPDVVLDISSDLDEVSQGEEDEEVGTTKGTLEVDWSELMAKPEDSIEKVVEEAGILKRRWSLSAVLNRVGLSEPLVGKEKYEKIIALANEDIEGTWCRKYF